jgi:dinuclear metal center YbgI/SA1388 family protein
MAKAPKTLRVSDLVSALDAIAPTAMAEPWDNVGLLLGDRAQPLSSALLCIDLSSDVVAEAAEQKCQAVVAYHPPIFEGLKRVTGGPVLEALRAGLAVYSPHTALDAAPGGTHDALADLLDLSERAPLRHKTGEGELKLVTFVPESAVAQLSDALFAAGAGRIGDYHSCSFRLAGTGTFFGEAGTQPKVGQRGRLEQVAEIRLETVVPRARLGAVVTALRQNHPYEEPAFDLVPLAGAPSSSGQGRVGTPPTGSDRQSLVARLKEALGVASVWLAGPASGRAKRVAVCAGAGGDLLGAALDADADLFITGELRHHDALRAARRGMTVVCTRHTVSERPVLPRLREQLLARLPDLELSLSRRDVDPFALM